MSRNAYVTPGARLRALLDERGMTQAELARLTTYSTKHINELVLDQAPISPNASIKLERALGVSASVFNQWSTEHRVRQLREAERSERKHQAQLEAARVERRQARQGQSAVDGRRRKR